MKMIHLLSRNTDQAEGRGPEAPVAAFNFLLNSHGEQLIKDAMDNPIISFTEIPLYEQVDDFIKESDACIRQRALAKLSFAERKALNL